MEHEFSTFLSHQRGLLSGSDVICGLLFQSAIKHRYAKGDGGVGPPFFPSTGEKKWVYLSWDPGGHARLKAYSQFLQISFTPFALGAGLIEL